MTVFDFADALTPFIESLMSGWQHLPLTVQTGDVDGLGCPDRVPAAGAEIFSSTALFRLKVLASWAVGACA